MAARHLSPSSFIEEDLYSIASDEAELEGEELENDEAETDGLEDDEVETDGLENKEAQSEKAEGEELENEEAPKSEELEDEEYEDDLQAKTPRGRHFRRPDIKFVPTVPTDSNTGQIKRDDYADAVAKAHVDAIMREIDAMLQAERKASKESASDSDSESDLDDDATIVQGPHMQEGPQPQADLEQTSAAVLVFESEPESEPASQSKPKPAHQSGSTRAVVLGAEGSLAHEADPVDKQPDALDDLDELDEPEPVEVEPAEPEPVEVELAEVAPAVVEPLETLVSSDNEGDDDPTLQLDRLVIAEQEQRPVERLEVSTQLPEEPAESAASSVALVPVKRREGFFARIGAFFARLFGLDKRR